MVVHYIAKKSVARVEISITDMIDKGAGSRTSGKRNIVVRLIEIVDSDCQP